LFNLIFCLLLVLFALFSFLFLKSVLLKLFCLLFVLVF
jgi:hypothetical protein